MEKTKTCTSCGKILPLSDFNLHSGTKDGHTTICKICKRIKSLEYESRPETKARRKKYNHDNKEKFDPIRKDWSKAHPERIKAYNNKQVKLLSKAYVINLLSKQGFNRKDITPELIETERAIIQTKRILWNR